MEIWIYLKLELFLSIFWLSYKYLSHKIEIERLNLNHFPANYWPTISPCCGTASASRPASLVDLCLALPGSTATAACPPPPLLIIYFSPHYHPNSTQLLRNRQILEQLLDIKSFVPNIALSNYWNTSYTVLLQNPDDSNICTAL